MVTEGTPFLVTRQGGISCGLAPSIAPVIESRGVAADRQFPEIRDVESALRSCLTGVLALGVGATPGFWILPARDALWILEEMRAVSPPASLDTLGTEGRLCA
jgi:hypothetical protein